MEFKFKEVVEESIIYFYDHVLSCNEYTEDVFEELDHVYAQAAKSNEYEAKNKELLEELKYLKKVNDDLVWQRDTDEEHEAKARAFDSLKNNLETEVKILIDKVSGFPYVDVPIESTISHFEHVLEMMKNYESGETDAKK